MSVPNKLLPQGGIDVGDAVYLLGIYQTDLYILTVSGSTAQPVMVKAYVNSSTGSTLNSAALNATTFTVNFSGDATIFQASGGRFLVPSSGVLTLATNQPSTEPIFLTQNSYTQFSSPSMILSSVPHRIFGGSSNTNIQVTLDTGSVVTMPIVLVPTSYFSGCTSGNTQPISDLQSVLNVTYCSHFDRSWCSTVSQEAWVSQSECLIGNTYTYCVNGVSCSGNCNSACMNSSAGAVCDFQDGSYVCVEPEENIVVINNSTIPLVTVESTSSWWWIVIIIAIILVILLIAAAVRYRRQPTIYHHHHEDYVNDHVNLRHNTVYG